jgi:hypothetical protein
MSRVQVQEIQPDRPLNPVQIIGDTFTGAPQPVQDQNMSRLAESLQQFSATIGRMPGRQVADPREAALREYLIRTPDVQQVQDAATGRVPLWDVPHLREIAAANIGQKQGTALFRDIQQNMASGQIPALDADGNHIDIWPAIQQRMSAAIEALPPHLRRDPAYMKAFQTTFESNRKDLNDQANATRAAWAKDQFTGVASTAMDSVIKAAGDTNNSDDAVKELWRRINFGADGKGGLTGNGIRPKQVMDDILVGRLKATVEKDPEAAARILSMDRGNGIGSMASDPRMREQVAPLIEQIREARKVRLDNSMKEQAAGAALDALRRGDQTFNALQDTEYQNPHDPVQQRRIISASEARELALVRARAESEASLQRQNVPPDVAAKELFQTEAQRYIGSNIPNRAWSQTINDVGRVLGNPAAATEPENVARLVAAQSLYENLNAKNPGYVKETLKIGDREERLFSLAAMYRDTAGMPATVAMERATKTMLNSTPEFSRAATDRVKAVMSNPEAVWFGMVRGSTINNKMMVQEQVEKLASAMAQDTSINPEDAVKAAAKIVSERIVTINGQSTIGNPFITQANVPMWKVRLDELLKTSENLQGRDGKITSAANLSVVPSKQDPSRFHVVDDKGFPVVSVYTDPADGKTIRHKQLFIAASEIKQLEGMMNQRRQELIQVDQAIAQSRATAAATQPGTPERAKAVAQEAAAIARRRELEPANNLPLGQYNILGPRTSNTAPGRTPLEALSLPTIP